MAKCAVSSRGAGHNQVCYLCPERGATILAGVNLCLLLRYYLLASKYAVFLNR